MGEKNNFTYAMYKHVALVGIGWNPLRILASRYNQGVRIESILTPWYNSVPKTTFMQPLYVNGWCKFLLVGKSIELFS